MGDYRLDRRRTLSGGMALVSACMLPRRTSSAPALSEPHATDVEDVEARDRMKRYIAWRECPEQQALWHAPFQAEFLAWLAESSDRFALPVSVDVSPTWTSLYAAGVNPRLMIYPHGRSGISVSMLHNGGGRTFVSFYVNAEEMADGAGWRNKVFLPQPQRIHATREKCWREDCFEIFLDWFNNDLVPATHIALYGEDEDDESRWSEARLLRDGCDARTRRPAPAGGLRALLPLRVPASATASDMTVWATSDAHGFAEGKG